MCADLRTGASERPAGSENRACRPPAREVPGTIAAGRSALPELEAVAERIVGEEAGRAAGGHVVPHLDAGDGEPRPEPVQVVDDEAGMSFARRRE